MKKQFKLSSRVKNIWVKALLSGTYEQGMGKLKQIGVTDIVYTKKQYQYCSLGIARECGLVAKIKNHEYVSIRFLPFSIQTKLFEMNDNGRSFKFIANWIKKNL